MRKVLAPVFVIAFMSGLALAQAPAPAPPPPNQITPQVLAEMLRTATTFHDLVRSLNLKQSLGPDVHSVGPDTPDIVSTLIP